ncbi:Crp/Fnr family transcriptional regulator [Fibrella aquatilis]|uniref:Crp/Fnr family transcriptional regulator n=1 Tax=Fibrella aquatilis TaxID=2817059 RepID=A0A939K1G9_9BACT|nr:Crp/Fnr family transcriptional regulator [Fibrella aquatilis]MBO0933503.1 Crp/Fnr family transcriptional regulator [Fibrella aquatilis]
MKENVFKNIASMVSLPPEEVQFYEYYFEHMTISRNTIIEEENKVPKYLYFINAGYMRLFYYDDNGYEQTSFFGSPNGFIASFNALINQTKSTENVECITDCDLLRISYTNTKELIGKSEVFRDFSLAMIQQALSAPDYRAKDLATLSAEQRYKKMLDSQPQLVQNIPLLYIASFLGIKPQSLSRIRKQIK